MHEDIKPYGNRLLAKIIEDEKTTKSGLVQVNSNNSTTKWAEVLGVADGADTDICEGDLVLFSVFQSMEVDSQDLSIVVVKLDDIVAFKPKVVGDELGVIG